MDGNMNEEKTDDTLALEDFIDWLNSHENDMLLRSCSLADTFTQIIRLIDKPKELITFALFAALVDHIISNHGGYVQSFGLNDNTYTRGLSLLMEFLQSDQEVDFDPEGFGPEDEDAGCGCSCCECCKDDE